MSVCLCFLVPRHALSLVIFFVCFGSYRMCHSHRGLPCPVFVRYLAILYNKKSVKVTCSSRSSRASQSPYTVEKQPKSTPDMYNPTHPMMGVGHIYTYPHGHSLLLPRLCTNVAKILMSRDQRSYLARKFERLSQ